MADSFYANLAKPVRILAAPDRRRVGYLKKTGKFNNGIEVGLLE